MDCKNTYRQKPSCLSDNDSSDSDTDWKRRTQKSTRVAASNPIDNDEIMLSKPNNVSQVSEAGRKRKINNIWSNVLEERDVSDSLGQCGFKKKPITLQDRNCESYDFRQKYYDTREDVSICGEDMDTGGTKDSKEIGSKKQKIRFRNSDMPIAKKIIYVLHEKKGYLIYRVVHFIGAQKALELLKRTEEIEDDGGMLMKNGLRRRAPGGVYLQLLKTDKDITKQQVDDIFALEERYSGLDKLNSKLRKKKKRRKMRNTKNPNSADAVPGEAMNDTSASITIDTNATVAYDASAEVSNEASTVVADNTSINKDAQGSDSSPIRSPEDLIYSDTKSDSEVEDGEIEDGEITED